MPDGANVGGPSLRGLHWLVETDVPTLMRLGRCSRYEIMQVRKLARAQLKKADLLECFAATERLRSGA